jgi:hypothetical protein
MGIVSGDDAIEEGVRRELREGSITEEQAQAILATQECQLDRGTAISGSEPSADQ